MTVGELKNRLSKARDDAEVTIEDEYHEGLDVGVVTVTIDTDGTEYVNINAKKKDR